MDLSDIRREYTRGGLRREHLPEEPMVLFEKWMQQAGEAGLSDPTAMTIATVDESGQPFQRIVLLKAADQRGFVFYTNLGSRKAQQLKHNNRISLHFPWHDVERQVHIIGVAEKLSSLEVMKYFTSRPRDSQISAWVSAQSSPISARSVLEGKFMEIKQRFANGDVPLPSFWGGYRVYPESIEFWQGGEKRLHDRFLFSRNCDSRWNIERLAP